MVILLYIQVVECCVKNCGVKFHNEIGKYKFINELIKLLSPKVKYKFFKYFVIQNENDERLKKLYIIRI